MLKLEYAFLSGPRIPRFGRVLWRKINSGIPENKPLPDSPSSQGGARLLVRDFQSLCTWKGSTELVDKLHKNIVYYEPESDKSGLVVLNKPYGLALRKTEDSPYCLESCLEELAVLLEVENLEVLKSAERFSSGITILGTSKATQAAVKKAMDTVMANRGLSTSYLAIVKGQPNIRTIESVDRIMTDCPEVNKPLFGSMHKEPVLSRKLNKYGVNMNGTKRVHVAISSLARSAQGAGVVELCPSNTGKHFIPVYLADIGHPLLGDQMYDYRARTVMGQRVKLSTAHTNARRTQVLPPNILELLGLVKGEEWKVPKMLHLHRLFLPNWLGRDKDLTVYAPPPPHWLKTCKVLRINFDYKVVAQEDKVRHWDKRVRKRKSLHTEEENSKSESKSDLETHISELS